MSKNLSSPVISYCTSLSSLLDYWLEGYFNQHGDPRIRHYPMMSSFRPFLTILLGYAAFVLYFGPRWMKNRPAYSLRPFMICYSFFMSAFNAFFVVLGAANISKVISRLIEFPPRYPAHDWNNQLEMSVRIYNYLYLITKLIDLTDTVCFVLRKKQSQVTALHFYHHFSVPFFGWIYFRLNCMCTLLLPFCAINSVLHSAMYAYYGLAAIGPAMRPYLWWKKYLTLLQIGQFGVLFVYGAYYLAFQIGYPTFLIYNHLLQAGLYFMLFCRFYVNTYRDSKQKSVVDSNNNYNNNIFNFNVKVKKT